MTGASTVERNVEMTNIWLNEISQELDNVDKNEAWSRLSAVMQTVRDRLPVDEAASFAAQLPDMIRGTYFGSWDPTQTPRTWRKRDEYLSAVNQKLGPREAVDAERTVRAVLTVAARHLDSDALEKVKRAHPKEIWDLWPS